MSVLSEINRIKSNVASAFSAVTTMGGTYSSSKSANLAAAILTIPVGGGASLTVNAYSSLPSSGTEDSIAIITSTSMTSWVVQPTMPTTTTAGTVWIDVGEGASTTIQLDNIQISPIRAYQYVSGAWQPVDAYVRKGSSWTQFSQRQLEIFMNGTTNTAVTTIVFDKHGASLLDGTRLKVRITGSGAEGYAGTGSKIDVSGFNSLCVKITCGSVNTSCSFGLRTAHNTAATSSGASYASSKTISMTKNTTYTEKLDIASFSGSYYIVVSTVAVGQTTYVNEIWLE